MKKSTLVAAILLAGMSTAIISPVYAEDVSPDSSGCPTGCGCQNTSGGTATEAPSESVPTPEPVPAPNDEVPETIN